MDIETFSCVPMCLILMSLQGLKETLVKDMSSHLSSLLDGLLTAQKQKLRDGVSEVRAIPIICNQFANCRS